MTAVGVEDAVQFSELEDAGCTYAQGFWFSEPLDVGRFNDFMQSYSPKISFPEYQRKNPHESSPPLYVTVTETGQAIELDEDAQ